jgi:hypothetical protein
MKEQAMKSVAAWLTSCETRFKNMQSAKLDMNGYPAFKKAMKDYDDKGYFTVGNVQYLFNRTDPRGAIPNYNTHKGYNKKYGDMLPCPVKDLVDSGLVNWRSGSGVMQSQFADAIEAETNWQWRMGNLRPKTNTTYSDLFGG